MSCNPADMTVSCGGSKGRGARPYSIRRKVAGCSGYGADASPPFENVDGMDVVGIHAAGAAQRTQDLRSHVRGHLFPRKAAEQGETECDLSTSRLEGDVTVHMRHTAGLMCPPAMPPLTQTPSEVPIAQPNEMERYC